MAEQLREPRAYELMTVFLPELSEEDGQAQLDAVSGYITSANGSVKEILTGSPWGRRRLAYTIRFNGVDYRDGIYAVYHFDAAPSAINPIERDLKFDTNTMRYLLVHDDPKAGEKYPPQPEGESAEQEGDTAREQAGVALGGTTAAAATSEATPEAEPEIATSKQGDPATTEAAAEEQPAETVTDDAVSANDEAETEPAPEQLDPESSQAPESRVVDTEAGAEGETTEATSGDESGTESTDDETAKE